MIEHALGSSTAPVRGRRGLDRDAGPLGAQRPPLPLSDLQGEISQQAVGDGDAQQRQGERGGVDVQAIEVQDLLAGLDGTAAVAELLGGRAGELDAAQAVARQGADLPLDGADVVDAREEAVDADAQHATQVDRDGQDDRHDADGEARVREHGEEDDAEALAARHDAEGRVRHEEIHAGRATQSRGKYGQAAEDARRHQLHRNLNRRVVQEERFEGIGAVAIFVVVYVPFGGIQGDAVQHADEEHAGHGLHEADSGLHSVVVRLERGEERRHDDTQPNQLADSAEE